MKCGLVNGVEWKCSHLYALLTGKSQGLRMCQWDVSPVQLLEDALILMMSIHCLDINTLEQKKKKRKKPKGICFKHIHSYAQILYLARKLYSKTFSE